LLRSLAAWTDSFFVDFAAVANLKDEHDDTIVFNAADEAEVFNAIAPKTGQVAAKWLAEPAGIFAAGNAIA